MKTDEIKAGRFYVDKKYSSYVRQIAEEYDDGDVRWRVYNLKTGEPYNDSGRCSKNAIVNWAEREATPAEIAKLDIDQALINEVTRALEGMKRILSLVTDEMLLDEVKRRGLKLE